MAAPLSLINMDRKKGIVRFTSVELI